MWYWQVFFAVVVVALLAVAVGLYVVAREDARARPWAILAGLSALALPASIIVHNVISALIGGEEVISFVIALLVAPAGFAVGALGAGIVTLRRDRVLGSAITLTGAGMALFAAYSLFALVVTAIEGGNPAYQGPVELVVLPVAALATVAGTLAIGLSLIGRRNLVRGRRGPRWSS